MKSATLPDDTLFSRGMDELIKEADVVKKEAIYKDLLKKYPEAGNEFRIQRYKNARTSLALFSASKGKAAQAMAYYKMIKKDLGESMSGAIASGLVRNKNYKEALIILEEIIAPLTASLEKGGSMYTYLQAADNYANCLFHLGKREEALNQITVAYNKSDKKNTSVNSTYSTILNSLGKHDVALPIMEQLVRDGMATDKVAKLFKDSYVKKNGSDRGFEVLEASLKKALKTKFEHEAVEKMINEPGQSFTVKDISGKTVSLADYRGKVVVLDFWATWCGPCIQSMPAMQTAANSYHGDPNVKFMFVNTGEKTADYQTKVRAFIKENGYNFHVIYDERDPSTNKCPVAASYGIRGIPTKLILDGDGNIRYRLVGFNGGDDATVQELTSMIEKTKREMGIQTDSFTIRGTTHLREGIAILNDYSNPDTAKIINGKFEFKGMVDRHNLISIEVPPSRSSRIILEPGIITVDHTKDGYRFGGAPLNVRFQKIEDELKPINDRINYFWGKYNKAEGEERIKIWREYNQAKEDKLKKTKEIVTSDGTFAGFVECLPVIRNERAANVKHYLDVFSFLKDDPRYKSQVKFYEGVARTDVGVTPPQWTLVDEHGKNISLASFKGKYVLVDFWYSGCHWCRKMTPGLINIYKELKGKGFEIVSVSVDPKKDEDKWRQAMKEDGAPWPQAWDMNKTLPEQYSVQGYPTMFFVGPDGKVLRKIFGYHDEPILREFFLSHMSKDKGNAVNANKNKSEK